MIGRKVYISDKLISLTIKEYEILVYFIENKGKIVTKKELFNYIWGSNSESEYQTLTVHIKWLREKIELNSKEPKKIQTVWGTEYRYTT